MAKDKVKVKLPKVDDALLEKSKKSQQKLETYFKENNLDPTKDYTKSKKHGEAVRGLLLVINANRDKIKETAPLEKHHSKSEDKAKKALASEGKEKKKSGVAQKYDYPKVNGQEMTSGEKKKYRVKMRAGNAKPEKVDAADKKTKTKDAKVEVKPEKKTVKATAPVVEKTVEKSDKKKKKHTHKED